MNLAAIYLKQRMSEGRNFCVGRYFDFEVMFEKNEDKGQGYMEKFVVQGPCLGFSEGKIIFHFTSL